MKQMGDEGEGGRPVHAKHIYFFYRYCYCEIRTQYLKSRVKFVKCKLKIRRLNLYSLYATVMNTCHIIQRSCLLLGHELH
jgi:hypothetical protein